MDNWRLAMKRGRTDTGNRSAQPSPTPPPASSDQRYGRQASGWLASRSRTFAKALWRAGDSAKAGRGDWRSFEPNPHLVTPITTSFGDPTEPFIVSVERLLRSAGARDSPDS